MNAKIRILHLEDDVNDAELIALQLNAELSCQLECVRSEKEFSAALDRGGFDVILADNTGPTFSGHSALALAKKKQPQVPFIFVTGASDLRDAPKAKAGGAAGYVLKDRLADLSPAIRSILPDTLQG